MLGQAQGAKPTLTSLPMGIYFNNGFSEHSIIVNTQDFFLSSYKMDNTTTNKKALKRI